jgi:hypothetical protein
MDLIGQMFTMVLVAAAIPSTLFAAFIGRLIWKGQQKAIKREAERLDKEKSRDEMILFILEGNAVALCLGKVTAEAVRDGHCNGNVTRGIADAEAFKSRQDVFFKKEGVRHLHESA